MREPAAHQGKPVLLVLTVASLLVNVGMAWHLLRNADADPAPSAPSSEIVPQTSVAENLSGGTQVPQQVPAAPIVNPQFSWASVESPDFRQYVANLRSIGCPEQLVRDLLHAELAQSFASRAAAIWSQEETPYWKKSVARQPNREQMEKIAELGRERERIHKELFGVGADAQELIDVALLQVHGIRHELSFLPPAQRDVALQTLAAEGIDAVSEFMASRGGDRDSKSFERKLNILAQVLSADQLEEYRLRHSPAATALKTELRYFDCTQEEFQRLLELREKAENPAADNFLDRSAAVEEFRKAFGDERAEEFARVTDLLYINARRGADEYGQPAQADQAWLAIQDGRKRIASIAESAAQPVEDRRAQIERVRDDTIRQVQEIMGKDAARWVVRDINVTFSASARKLKP